MLNLELYLIPFLSSFVLSVVLIFLIRYFSNKFSLGQKNCRVDSRHVHSREISRWGGIAIAVSFLSVILLDKNLVITKDIGGVLLGGLMMFATGLWDDLSEMKWQKQLFFQLLAVAIIFIFGVKLEYLSSPWGGVVLLDNWLKIILGLFFVIVWSLLLINAMNWIDGIDGLSMGIYFISLVAVFILSLKPEVNQPPVGIISLALAGAVFGFLIFNFPPAKIMAGSSGIFFVGFMMAGLSIFAGTKIATTLLILFLPLMDFFWVIKKRLSLKKSIFHPDNEHLHHKLLNIGWTQKQINLLAYLVTIGVAFLALNIEGVEKIFILFFLAMSMIIFYNFISRKECKI